MRRALSMLTIAAALLIAACSGAGSSPGTSFAPISPDTSPLESPAASETMDTMSPEASPS
jgi:hypothetical protein